MTENTAKLLKLRDVVASNRGNVATAAENKHKAMRFPRTSASVETLSFCYASQPFRITSL